MKKIVLVFILFASLSSLVFAEWVNGYSKSNGKYVNGYNRSKADSSKYNNWGY